jgi:hypothetical protein
MLLGALDELMRYSEVQRRKSNTAPMEIKKVRTRQQRYPVEHRWPHR